AHVRNGIECQECHGPVETMDRVRQSSDLTMGWCVNCHRHDGREAPTHWKRAKGALDCAACHQ
ncbi:MAG: cytochrome c3 family protein, partial [Planctomycetota bacterium]